MASEAVRPLRRSQGVRRPVPVRQLAPYRARVRFNTILGVGLWALLWLGYNTGPWWLADSGFPHHSVLELFHGIRAYAPMLGGWIAVIVIFSRAERLSRWMVSPVGLVVMYGLVGLFASMAVSKEA